MKDEFQVESGNKIAFLSMNEQDYKNNVNFKMLKILRIIAEIREGCSLKKLP